MMLMSAISFAQKVMPPSPSSNEQEVFTVVEEMPRFPGCETMKGDQAEIKKCSGEKLFQYIFANLKYPEDAKKNGVQGTVIAKFVVTKNGEIGDIIILRDLGYGLGDAAKQVLKNMNTIPVKWIPGRQRGKAVNVYYTLPIKFDLGMNEKSD
jgi:periplasmic protein TonB